MCFGSSQKGILKQNETWDAESAQTFFLDRDKSLKLQKDGFSKLENQRIDSKVDEIEIPRLEKIIELQVLFIQSSKEKDYDLNCDLRKKLREEKMKKAEIAQKDKNKPIDLKILDLLPEEKVTSKQSLARLQIRKDTFASLRNKNREEIRNQSIFSKKNEILEKIPKITQKLILKNNSKVVFYQNPKIFNEHLKVILKK